ncbi:Poly(beta-D-mannuronate) C5 epimerase 2 [Methylobrevis pamukkalensis]|uniref:Poly(Beta-D-mannuronate) C5 epimerase 2 n=2 Tax=Methylobrevis pamukkalensis TaxID=1439726 RepID=A0A1E3H421_9HYPH|nr:Poly(beta-D-mannuronate) C5 epimerase 2 [Methylobrevis pamukkalensis]
MASISFSIENVVPEFSSDYSTSFSRQSDEFDPVVVALEDGGFAVAYEWLDTNTGNDYSIILDIYNQDGTIRAGGALFPDTFVGNAITADISMTQLSTGGILVTWTDTDDPGIHHAIIDPTDGSTIVADTKLPTTDGNDFVADVWALPGGGWALVKQDNLSADDQDADLIIYDANGAFVLSRALNGNSGSDEQDPAVTVLTNGNIAIAYEVETTDGTDTFSMGIEIVSPTGTVILGPTVFDDVGTQNRHPEIVALADGGFAVVYEDNGPGGGASSIAVFNADGSVRGITRFDLDSVADTDISLTQLRNGLIYITFTDNVAGTDIRSALVDPLTLQVHFSLGLVENQGLDQRESSVAVFGNGSIVTAWTDTNSAIEDGNVDPDDTHVSIQIDRIVRTTTSDDTGESLTGDGLRDVMLGNGGDDELDGQGGNDLLNGGDDDDTLLGRTGNDELIGGSGNDILDGGANVDTMTGGTGDDDYFIDNVNDVVVELAGEGTNDRIFTTRSVTLAADQDIEVLAVTNIAGTSAINLTGNGKGQTLEGNNGTNTLDGKGGPDTMIGHDGDDTYFVNHAGDNVVEADGEGNDTINTTVTYSLVGRFVETLNITAAGQINATGNGKANTINGGIGNNIIDGGVAADTMAGKGGNDTYIVDNIGDNVIELDGEGDDTINSSVSYSLVGRFVETLILTGTGNKNATGNGKANTLIGNSGNNVLDGGVAADTMEGKDGNDTYIVDNIGDVVIEADGEGNDTINSSVSYSLVGRFVETLVLTGGGAKDGTGNGRSNTLVGNAGVNVLDGGGAADILEGNGGNDTFRFSSALGINNIDTISDFNVAADTIELDDAIFSAIGLGALAAGRFVIGAAAGDANDRIIYNDVTGALIYDSNGNAAGGAVQFATISTGLAMTSADFVVA